MTQPARPIYRHISFILLLLAQLVFGLFAFRDYGLSWDEPLFYEYGEALGYAYTPANWLSPDFDLSKSYGSSGDDHKNRGPAYLLLARTPVHLLESLGLDEVPAWRLVNFLTFLLGVYFLYRLSLRWMGEWAAFGAAALFSTQPLLLGHAFINPKDMPFLVFFTGAALFGFEMADALNDEAKSRKRRLFSVIVAAFFLGISTSIRVLAPLAGLLVVVYAIVKQRSIANPKPRTWNLARSLLAYILLSLLFMLASWPYLWESPISNFIQVFRFMSENPTGLQVLFGGQIYRAYELPRRYLPTLLAITLTEPVWPLFALGLGAALAKLTSSVLCLPSSVLRPPFSVPRPPSPVPRPPSSVPRPPSSVPRPPSSVPCPPSTDYWLLLTAFAIPLLYVLLRKPPMYDGFRHFLFILPPVFVTCGLGLDVLFRWLKKLEKGNRSPSWLRAGTILLVSLPGLLGAARLHPYQYAYYNSFVGGTGGAFRVYETDYWLTCYKEAAEQTDFTLPARLFVHREASIAAPYAVSGLTVLDERGNLKDIRAGDYILVNSRTNEDRKTFHDAPTVGEVRRGAAVFCVVKQVP
ncbi:MAG: hypothetical protein JETCAE02_08110 [Anaerolineaceae bacterium]|nr:hypothetical protein [Anaerolineae bacterium]MBL1171922.1 hypothetical protein [Chloroflexota bacterium]MDL1925843.1 hypothetical protein [Anaerolineae bacterium AMX1]WKZ53306.1 MAG: hypothetical protein QY324_10780 [Anaerolineales bacterium]GJQ38399.1 MAG: hypothetical protein JETCAE02_08110 [Anaerolineaceae bacterium]